MVETKKIKLFVMDVDGTLTDGKLYIGAEAELYKAFNIKDGYGVKDLLPSRNIVPVIMTGRSSGSVQRRAEELGITEIHQGIKNKVMLLKRIAEKIGCSFNEIAYIGDDLNDIECINVCGLSACPNDAVADVKKEVDYVCERRGGDGCVREFIDFVISKNTI